MQPTLHTSTLEDILGGFGPWTNTSGGRYLQIKDHVKILFLRNLMCVLLS